jgi:hypothetical protein
VTRNDHQSENETHEMEIVIGAMADTRRLKDSLMFNVRGHSVPKVATAAKTSIV